MDAVILTGRETGLKTDNRVSGHASPLARWLPLRTDRRGPAGGLSGSPESSESVAWVALLESGAGGMSVETANGKTLQQRFSINRSIPSLRIPRPARCHDATSCRAAKEEE
jgi:hypothetical protein